MEQVKILPNMDASCQGGHPAYPNRHSSSTYRGMLQLQFYFPNIQCITLLLLLHYVDSYHDTPVKPPLETTLNTYKLKKYRFDHCIKNHTYSTASWLL